MNIKLGLAALAIYSLALTAHAEVRSFKFVGGVTATVPMAPMGKKITGTFSYDTAAAPIFTNGDASGPGYGQSSYIVQSPLKATVNGHKIECTFFYVDVFNNMGGNVEDQVSIYCQPITLDGTYLLEGALSITLATDPGNTNVIRSTALPRNLKVKRYDESPGVVMVDGSSNGTVLSFEVDQVKAH